MRAPRFLNQFDLPNSFWAYGCPVVSLEVVRETDYEQADRSLAVAVKLWVEKHSDEFGDVPNTWLLNVGTSDTTKPPSIDAFAIREAALRLMTKAFWRKLSDMYFGVLNIVLPSAAPAEIIQELASCCHIPAEMMREVLDNFPSYFDPDQKLQPELAICVESVLDLIIKLRTEKLLEPPYRWEHLVTVHVLNPALETLCDLDWSAQARLDDVHGLATVCFEAPKA